MPRARHAQGRPGTAVIPADWAATHQVPAGKTMVGATATLRHPGTTQAWSDAEQQMVAVPLAAYATDELCRAQALAQQARDFTAAEDTETVAMYLVVVPAVLEPVEGDLVALACDSDPALDGKRLEIQQVVRGSIRWERDLFCTLID